MSEKKENSRRVMHEPSVKSVVEAAIDLARQARRLPSESVEGDRQDCRPERRPGHGDAPSTWPESTPQPSCKQLS